MNPTVLLGLILAVLLTISGMSTALWLYGERRYQAGKAEGAAAVAASLNAQSSELAKEALDARAPAEAAGAFARLRRDWCIDCP